LLALCLTAAGAAAVLEGDPMRLPNTRPTELAAGSGELLPDKLRILIIVRGISYSSRYRNGANSYERTHQNFFSHMVEPWRQQGHSVDVGLSTYDSEKLPEIRVLYSPVFVFATKTSYNAPSRTKLDSIVEGLQAALDAGGANRWDFIAVTRFDIELRQPITQYSIDFGKMNFPWPEKNWKDETFASLPRVGDAMQLFNSAYLRVLLDGFRNLVQLAKALRSNSSYNNGHRILTVMDIDLQEDVHCILNATHPSRWNRANAIYREAVSETLSRWQPSLRKTLESVGNPPVTEHRRPQIKWPKHGATPWMELLDSKTMDRLTQRNKLMSLRVLPVQ